MMNSLSILLLLMFCGFSGTTQEKPNVIVIYTDDWGYGDLSCMGALPDIRTPNLDLLASQGTLFTNGYVSAPQCAPSRAGLLTGRYQQRFGFNTIPDAPLPRGLPTIGDRMREAGYVTGMVGKWHLDPTVVSSAWYKANAPEISPNARGVYPPLSEERIAAYLPGQRGFDFFFCGQMYEYFANYTLDGTRVERNGTTIRPKGYRLDIQTDAALEFIRMNRAQPFFLYLAYHGPHTPLEAPKEYLELFPGEMAERRRYALAMMYAIDKGIGKIQSELETNGLLNNTVIIFMSDNGAPLKMTMEDTPLPDFGGWDGSLNTPLLGEKGMLTEGGIRVPAIISWPRRIPKGIITDMPIISLDVLPTVLASAGIQRPGDEDGVNLLPYLTKENNLTLKRDLYWRFWNQGAIRDEKWKYLRVSDRGEFLFDLESDPEETKNLITQYPEIARKLEEKLATWAEELQPKGLSAGRLNNQEEDWYRYYLDLHQQ